MGNRARIVTEIIKRIKEQAGSDFPIFVELNAMDGFQPGSQKAELGITILQVVETAELLEKAGVCSIEVSGGISEVGEATVRAAINSLAEEAYFREYSKAIKKAVNIPVIFVEGIQSLSFMELTLKTLT